MVGAKGVLAALALSPAFVSAGALAQNGYSFMFHCCGGIGTDRLDAMTALINWVENGVAPASITASQVDKGKLLRTRPLCPYPQVARYAGPGSPDDAANFACRAPD